MNEARTCTNRTAPRPASRNPKARLRGLAQRVVDLGPDGPVAAGLTRVRTLTQARNLRRDDGQGIVPETWFATLYERDADPWGYVGSDYEARKYALTLAALPSPRYRHAYEPGCSIGLLSADLALRCDQLLCSDYAPAAVERARDRLGT
ncbi:MAG: hypothetical protein GEV08_21200 [Acidimicrobiia bacterium]|nr:hypothetical protein [Acidimicrobiia bacterium]